MKLSFTTGCSKKDSFCLIFIFSLGLTHLQTLSFFIRLNGTEVKTDVANLIHIPVWLHLGWIVIPDKNSNKDNHVHRASKAFLGGTRMNELSTVGTNKHFRRADISTRLGGFGLRMTPYLHRLIIWKWVRASPIRRTTMRASSWQFQFNNLHTVVSLMFHERHGRAVYYFEDFIDKQNFVGLLMHSFKTYSLASM